MTVLEEIDVETYGRLLAEALPSVIQTEEENERLLGIVRGLMGKRDPAAEERKLMSLLIFLTTCETCGLIEQFEASKYPMGDSSTPQSMVQHLMEARGLTHKDVWQLFGARGIASEVLNGKRGISKGQAKRLAEFFQVPADVFI